MIARSTKWPGPTARARKAKAAKRQREYRKMCAQIDQDSGGEHGYVPCARCGRWVGGVHHHHKRARSLAPELRTEKSNIEPLCAECHMKEHASRDWSLGHIVPVATRLEREP